MFILENKKEFYVQRSSQGGLRGLSPAGPVKSMDFRGFSAPTGAVPPQKIETRPTLDRVGSILIVLQ